MLTARKYKLMPRAERLVRGFLLWGHMPVMCGAVCRIFLFSFSLALVSCGSSYNIQGSSDVAMLDGRMLYLKVYKDSDFKTIDSCDVVHGQFHFNGPIDTVRMGTLFMDDNGILPVVLENGDIVVSINNTQRRVSGTPLNEKLFDFLDSYSQLVNQYADLKHKHSQAIMDGEDEASINRRLSLEAAEIIKDQDKLVTSFITSNFDNVLGSGVFFMVTAGFRYPVLQPWIEDIMSKATDNFKNDPYVKDYYDKAKTNEAIMNGTHVVDEPSSEPDNIADYGVPTPNEMARPR